MYFGELTFCHGSGWEPIKPKEKDFSLGNLWDEYK
ncbi:ATP-grasp fold amidoligase family protein [Vibrio parahaemolyticus]|nr:ATP-grasp fold amidoligase family protein [Vibrio parahaemolyticus]